MWKDKVTNESVLTKLKTKRQLLSDIQKRRLKYFGHIKIKNNTLTTVLEGKLEGKRPRGWPWNNWMVDIKEWTCQPAYACTSQAADRDLWSVNARQLSKRWWHSQIPDTRNGTFWNRSAYHLSSYNCSVNRPCLIESLWKNYIHASELCCCDDAVWKLFTGISQFCSIFLELLQHLICCSFGLTLRQVLYKAMLTFSFHMISRILFLFENNQSTRDVVVSVLTSQNTRLSPWLTFINSDQWQVFIPKWDEKYERYNGIAAGTTFSLSPHSPHFIRMPVLPFPFCF